MLRFSLLPTLLAAAGLAGCGGRVVPAGQDVEPFVGRAVTIDGTVERTIATMPAADRRNGYCLTVPPGGWPRPVLELTLVHHDASIAFQSSRGRPLVAGDRVRVTGRLYRVAAANVDAPAGYELRNASWRRLPQ